MCGIRYILCWFIRLDGFFHNNINLWDIAAGVLIVQEAGGKVNDISKYEI